MRQNKHRKAFTIVELVVVIAVIAILSAVLVPTISGVIQKANHSADTQFAASLTIQLAMESVDGDIKNEAELRDAINKYYGAGFYDTLAPKSGKYGYHFWYDVAEQTVVLKSYEELVAPVAGRAVAAPSFSPASPRSLMVNTPEGLKNYFLLDQAGSELADQLKALDSVNGNGEYGLAVTQLAATEAETDLAAQIASRLQSIAIANSNGLFFCEDWAGPVSHVYVPYGTETLGASKIPSDITIEVSEIILPDTLTQIGTGSLLGFSLVANNPATYEGSTTIYANVTEDKLEDYVATDSFNCVLQIPTGERFAFVNGVLTKLGTSETFVTDYSVNLKSFVVTAPADTNHKYDLHAWGDGTNTLHYTSDFNGTITLSASRFVDENDNVASRTATWKVGETDTTGNSLTLTKADLFGNTAITVSAQNVTYTIDLVKVAIDSFTASIGGVNGEPHQGDDGYAYYTATLEYKKGSSWTVDTNVTLAPVVSCVSMSNATDIAVSGAGASNLTVDGTTLKVNDSATGNFAATVTITTEGTDTDGNTNSIKYVLTFKMASSTFALSENAAAVSTYKGVDGNALKFTVGTVQPIKLGTLFKLVSGEPSNIVVTWSNNGGTPSPFTFTSQSGDWTNWEITPAQAGENFAISISDGGATCTLNVSVKDGAYNVATKEEWLSVPNDRSIALLYNIDIPEDAGFSLADGNTMQDGYYSGTNYYSKRILGKHIYGNMKKITAPDSFKIKSEVGTGSNNFLIYMSGNGTINDLIIDGPGYTESSNVYKSTSYGDKVAANGYYVAGVEMSGGTINNSYISGFRSPVRVDGGTVNINKTTLVGGAFANIYVAKISSTSTITLDNVTTIQWGDIKGIIGAGIFFDDSSGSITLNLKNNTVQYNWAYNGGSYKGYAAQIVNQFFKTNGGCGDDKDDYKYAAMIHKIGNTDYANTGIIFEKSQDNVTLNTSELNKSIPAYITDDTRMKYSNWEVYNYADCSTDTACNHDLFPDENGDGKFTIDDFLKAKEK